MDILIPIAFFVAVVFIIQIIANYKLKNRLLEKEVSPESVEMILKSGVSAGDKAFTTLRWGLVTLAIGLAFFLTQIIPVLNNDKSTVGLIFLCGGIGLIISYVLEQKKQM